MIPILSIKNLSVRFVGEPMVHAVKNSSFDVQKGEILGIVGESGSGKTQTALAIAMLSRAQIEGEILLHTDGMGVNLLDSATEGLRGRIISMIFQDAHNSLNPSMRCGEQIEEVCNLHFPEKKENAKNEILELLSKCQIKDTERIFSSFPHQLSGGQMQRVQIAIALASKPQILIADEPTTALDADTKNEILDLLKKLGKEDKLTLLLISHDLAAVSRVADRILVMKEGEIIEEGTKTTIFSNSKSSYTKSLLAMQPQMEKRYKRFPVLEDFENANFSIDSFYHNEGESETLHERLYNQEPLLKLNGISLSFSKKKHFFSIKKENVNVLEQFDMSIYPNEILGLCGSSGSGKTTIGRIIAGLQSANNGTITWGGNEKKRPRVQMIFQDPFGSLNPKMKIGDMLMEAIGATQKCSKEHAKQEALAFLKVVGLGPESFERFPRAFSGGQRQRLAIARALAQKPDLLICDEIVSALDVSVQGAILNLILEIRKDFGLSCLFISHDKALTWQLCDRVVSI